MTKQQPRTNAYVEGYQAYHDQQGTKPFPEQGQNPYSPNSSDYYDWAKGWNDHGEADSQELQYQESYWG
jgi:hypothetical protein